MSNPHETVGYKACIVTFVQLFVLSMGMLVIGSASIAKSLQIPVLIVGMLLMAWLIVSRYMHLREEKLSATLTVVGSTAFCAVALFVLIAFDGARIFHLAPR